jgi:hypothetical protein
MDNHRKMRVVIILPDAPDDDEERFELVDFIRDKVSEWTGHLHPEYYHGPNFRKAIVKEEVL